VYLHCGYTLLLSVQPLPLLSLTLLPPNPHFSTFQYISLYPLPSQMLCFRILLMFYHSLFPFPLPLSSIEQFHYYEYVLCVCVNLLDPSFAYERKHVVFVFLSLAYFTYLMSSSCIHLLSNHMLLILVAV
jgi:hypothetical protein